MSRRHAIPPRSTSMSLRAALELNRLAAQDRHAKTLEQFRARQRLFLGTRHAVAVDVARDALDRARMASRLNARKR